MEDLHKALTDARQYFLCHLNTLLSNVTTSKQSYFFLLLINLDSFASLLLTSNCLLQSLRVYYISEKL